jgi:hypothetical protein
MSSENTEVKINTSSFLTEESINFDETEDLEDIVIDKTNPRLIISEEQLVAAQKLNDEIRKEIDKFKNEKQNLNKDVNKSASKDDIKARLRKKIEMKKNLRSGNTDLDKFSQEDAISMLNSPQFNNKMKAVSNKKIDKKIDKMTNSGAFDNILGKFGQGTDIKDILKTMK